MTIAAAAVTVLAAVAVIAGVSVGQAPSGPADDLAAAAGRAGNTAPAHTAHSAKPGKHQAASQHQAPSRPEAASKHQLQRSAPAKHDAPSHHASLKPYLLYDSVTPSAIPAGHAIATYATGNYAISPAQVADRKTVIWIDTTGTYTEASALDIEPGDATPEQAATWTWQRLHDHPNAIARLYCSQSEWPAVQAAVASLPASMRSHIRWWIADPTGVEHMVPGSDATQWYWGPGYDISTALPRF